MHLLARADDGIYRTRGKALRATDADFLVDLRHQRRTFNAVGWVERQWLAMKQGG
jgi:hypothetical protein